MSIGERLHRLDGRQQQSRHVGFIAAVIKKFSDDQGGELAGLIAFYGFLSLFPLLLVFVTVLGFLLQGDPHKKEQVLNGTLGEFPLISEQISHSGLKGSGAALAIGIVGSLLAGLRITSVVQNAFNRIWSVPFKERPDFLRIRLRGLAVLALLGVMSIISTGAAGFVGTASHQATKLLPGIFVALLFNVALFMTAFKLLTAEELQWRQLLPGVIVAAIGWQLLQSLGGFYLAHELKKTGPLYGTFALVLGLLAWLYLGAQLTVYAAEINVVKARGLWPRSLFSDPLLDADRRALTASAEIEERVPQENVDVDFDQPR
jgi:YihY family inner membrane protein